MLRKSRVERDIILPPAIYPLDATLLVLVTSIPCRNLRGQLMKSVILKMWITFRYSESSLFRIEHKVRYSYTLPLILNLTLTLPLPLNLCFRNNEPFGIFGITNLRNIECPQYMSVEFCVLIFLSRLKKLRCQSHFYFMLQIFSFFPHAKPVFS